MSDSELIKIHANGQWELLDKRSPAKERFDPTSPKYDPTKAKDWKWQHGGSRETRRELKFPDKQSKIRALTHIIGKTTSRRNPETNEPEVLLHRGVGPNELENVSGKSKTHYHHDDHSSWTPDYNTAHTFAMDEYESHHGDFDKLTDKERDIGKQHVLSAWVPLNSIQHFPNILSSPQKKDDKWDEDMRDKFRTEQEVIVQPGKFERVGEKIMKPYHAKLDEDFKGMISK